MNPPLNPQDREVILRCASLFTSSPTAAVVVHHAAPLVVWARAATDAEDLEVRMVALRRTCSNLSGSPDFEPHDNPGAFLAEAQIYYRMLTGAAEPEEAIAPDFVPDEITTQVMSEIDQEGEEDR